MNEGIVKSLNFVKNSIANTCKKLNIQREVRLVAVSKTKSHELIKACYDAGQRHFGENYVQELCAKAPQLPKDIRWHFIGSLQSNKAKQLASIENLWMVETIDRQKIATALDKAIAAVGRKTPLNVFVQVNTSAEESKSGCDPKDCVQLVKFVIENCPHLKFCGLMTIGSILHSKSQSDDQPDFELLCKCRDEVCKELSLKKEDVELSMGMSSDYLKAIEYGSTNVRVGSTIFGEREYKK